MRHLINYVFIGSLCALIEFFVFINSIEYLGKFLSNNISLAAGVVVSFILNSRFNFKKTDKVHRRLLKFLVVNFMGAMVSNFSIYLIGLMYADTTSKLLSMPFVALTQFILNKKWTFRTYKNAT